VALIIPPGDSDASSFNDDSSPDTRLTSGHKVEIIAQVLPESSLDWYYRILQLCASVQGELKSTEVWSRFSTLHGENKDRIWTGLSKVRIHIVDPRPYRKAYVNIIRKFLPSDDPATFLKQQAAAKEPKAVWLLMRSHFYTAGRILNDSIAARVHYFSRLQSEGLFLTTGGSIQGDVLDLSDFGNDAKPLVRKVSSWSAKSAATFHEALDSALAADEESRHFPNPLIRRRMKARVLKTHAFDEGNPKHLRLLESARGNILENLKEPYESGMKIKPYSQTDSKDSFLVQAADIAGGIASRILETPLNLVAVASSFEYVTYNGKRISVKEAEEEIRRLAP
jgi:hypothetical protein